MLLRTFVINAFVDPDDLSSLGSGNPAAVVLLTEAQNRYLSDGGRQSIATQMNYADTAFVAPEVSAADGTHEYSLCWFTPKTEVDLCGHATLAAAATLVSEGRAKGGDVLRFHTRKAGVLTVEVAAAGSGLRHVTPPFTMQFPSLPSKYVENPMLQSRLTAALGLDDSDVIHIYKSVYDLVVLVKDVEKVRKVKMARKELISMDSRGVIVTAEDYANGELPHPVSFACRFFAPKAGIDEDAVTGSAYCAIAGIYLRQGENARARQLSERGGTVIVGLPSSDMVSIGGWTRVVLRGMLEL